MRILLLSALYLAQLAAGQVSSSSSSSGPAAVSSSSVMLMSSSSSARSSSSAAAVSSSSSSGVPSPTLPRICSGAGYSLESLRGQVFTAQFGNWNYSIAVCGHLPPTTRCEAGSSFGQINANTCNYLMKWDGNTVTTWTGLPNGVSVAAATGAMCGANPRRTNMEFRCNAAATTPRLLSVSEPSTCFYVAVIETAAVCTPTGSTGPANGVGSSWYDYTCGGGLYDFSSIGDIMFDSNTTSATSGYYYYVNICGRVQNQTCSSVQPTSVCQSNKATSRWNLSFFNNSVANLHTLTADGMSINVATGQACGTSPREALLNIHCTGAVPAVITSQSEYASCKYSFEINTACPLAGAGRSSSSTGLPQPSTAASTAGPLPTAASTAASTAGPLPTAASTAGPLPTSVPRPSSSAAARSSSSTGLPQPSTSASTAGPLPTGVPQPSSAAVPSSVPFVPEFPEGTVRVTMSVQLSTPVNASNFEQMKTAFEADIANNIARATNVSASALDGLVEVTSIAGFTSSPARRLLQAETPITFLILGNITRVVTNLGVDAALVAQTVALTLANQVASGDFLTNNTGAVVPRDQTISVITITVSSSTGSQPGDDDDLNGASSLSQSMALTVLCALVALVMAL